MATITVQCDWCDELVEGLISAIPLPDDEATIATGGFYLFDGGVVCDDCIQETDRDIEPDTQR